MDPFSSHRNFRDFLVSSLRRELFGPSPEDGSEALNEEISLSPLQKYSAGVLFPRKTSVDPSELPDESEAGSTTDSAELNEVTVESGRTGRRGSRSDEGASDQQEPLNLANEFNPSAVGISFKLLRACPIVVRISFGTYSPTVGKERNSKGGEIGADGKPIPEFRELAAYQRHHRQFEIPLTIPDRPGRLPPLSLAPDIKLRIYPRVRVRDGGSVVVSLMAVNDNEHSGLKAASVDATYFQVSLSAWSEEGQSSFHPIDRPFGNTSQEELAALDLLYRHRRSFALGHGCAGDWNRDERLSELGSVDWVGTACIPTFEIKPIVPREQAFNQGSTLNLSMRHLFAGDRGGSADKQVMEALKSLADDYQSWIAETENAIESSVPKELRPAAMRHVTLCRTCLNRILAGIAILEKDRDAMKAFRLMNKAMLIQQYRSSLLKRRTIGSEYPEVPQDYLLSGDAERKWRPFQLAFILMNIDSMIDSDCKERRVVDLIWFPTGGGKTEAYLGLSAFSILYERMMGQNGPRTIVLMRYTLRLLTAQQFQRAAALILALESMRRDKELGVNLGADEISIGLWVGKSLTPNKRDAARSALATLQQDRNARNPFQLLECPWCRVELGNRESLGYAVGRLRPSGEKTVVFKCPDAKCRFGATQMPVVVIDEDIYDSPPTLVIGTVDKFAQLAWDERVGSMFGGRGPSKPPTLIIQDELHLISGPLGTIVGLYESVIDRMCSRDGHVAKIIASTATIRRAHEQCKNLYSRDTFEFPPQGIRAGDSYFALEDEHAPGRLYVGVMATAVKSHQTALVRTASPLLQSVCRPTDNDKSKQDIADPYGTVVWYFNSLRELGHAATLCVGDIPEFLKGLCHRNSVAPDDRRYVREVVELTSRRSADEIPQILQQLDVSWRVKPEGQPPIDVLLATNMISVGVDVPRLGLIIMSGQPKSTSEYIQASSRVGRRFPGLVVTVYTQSKSRDRSHYERFVAYHQSIYRFVEPTSVTPFSPQARERGMRGVLIALARQVCGVSNPGNVRDLDDVLEEELTILLRRIADIDEDERDDSERELRDWIADWQKTAPAEYGRMGGAPETTTLMYPFGSNPDQAFQRDAWPIMTSMRDVDGTCEAQVLNRYLP